MIDHVDEDRVALRIPLYQHPCDVSWNEHLVVLEAAGEEVDAIHLQALVLSREDAHMAALVACTEESCLYDRAVVGGEHLRPGPCGIDVDRAFESGGDQHQNKRCDDECDDESYVPAFLCKYHI